MTALRIFRTANPSMIGARVEPMSKADAQFWQLLAARRKARAHTSHPSISKGVAE